MNATSARLLFWTPRVLGILVSIFIGLFALDAFSEGKPWLQAAADFAIHLVPSLIVLAVVLLAWRWEWVGGVAFVALALLYMSSTRRLDWIAVIAGPLLLVGVFYFWSWRHHAEVRRAMGLQ